MRYNSERTIQRHLADPLDVMLRANYVYESTAIARLGGSEREDQLIGAFYTSKAMEHRLFMMLTLKFDETLTVSWRLHTEGIPGDFSQPNITDDPKLVGGKVYPYRQRHKAVDDMRSAMRSLVKLYHQRFGFWDGPIPFNSWYSERGLSDFEPWQVAEYKRFKGLQ